MFFKISQCRWTKSHNLEVQSCRCRQEPVFFILDSLLYIRCVAFCFVLNFNTILLKIRQRIIQVKRFQHTLFPSLYIFVHNIHSFLSVVPAFIYVILIYVTFIYVTSIYSTLHHIRCKKQGSLDS